MKKLYASPELTLENFDTEDIMVASGGTLDLDSGSVEPNSYGKIRWMF